LLTAFSRIFAERHVGVFDKCFYKGTQPSDIIEQMDTLMDKGQVLKNDDTCYVSRVTWNGEDVVVKRFNHKGFIHSLRHTIKKSRARRGWLHANRLVMLHISTARPLAYIEQCKGLLVWKSYLITEYVKGQRFNDFLTDGNVTDEKRSEVTRQVSELVGKLGKYRITHGDLKHTNILITENGPVLMDLDGMKVHRWQLLFRIKRDKDIARLKKK